MPIIFLRNTDPHASSETKVSAAKVLIVDDEASLRDFLSILFEGEGWNVDAASSLGEARLQRLKGNFLLATAELKRAEISQIKLGLFERAIFNLEMGCCWLESNKLELAIVMLREAVFSLAEAQQLRRVDHVALGPLQRVENHRPLVPLVRRER